MRRAPPVALVYEGALQLRVGLIYVSLYFLAQVADDKYKLCDACVQELVDDDAEDRPARDRYQGLWLRIGERP